MPKQPDQSLVAEHRRLVEHLATADDFAQYHVEIARNIRAKLTAFVAENGDMIAKQEGFERHQAWEARETEPHPDIEVVKAKNTADIEAMVGIWWDKVENGVPIPFPTAFELCTNENFIGPLDAFQFRKSATMADLVVRIGLFPSLSEARKAGHNKPITLGEHRFKNGKMGIKRVIITEHFEDTFDRKNNQADD
jgi:hypothetical protein